MNPSSHESPRVWVWAPNALPWLKLIGCEDLIASPEMDWGAFQKNEAPEIPPHVWMITPEEPVHLHPNALVFQPTTLKKAIDRTMQMAFRMGRIQDAIQRLGREEARLMHIQQRHQYNHKRDSTLTPIWFLNPFDVTENDFAILEDLCEQSGGKLSFPNEMPDDPRLEGDAWCFSTTADATEPWFELSKATARALLPALYNVIEMWSDWIFTRETVA